VYARIATGEAKGSIGVMVRNPGFVIGRARKASLIARDALADLSENLSPYQEGFRFLIEFEFAKLLIKRKPTGRGAEAHREGDRVPSAARG